LLEIARSQGQSDLARGIDIAKSIPRGSSAYSAAQEQIKTWQEFLNPQPEPQPQPESLPFPQSTTTGGQ
jgi:hypothetical protein